MKISKIGPNITEVCLVTGHRILVSYETPVAAFVPSKGYIKSDRFFSRTTGRHIVQWVKDGAGQYQHAETVPHSAIVQLMEGA